MTGLPSGAVGGAMAVEGTKVATGSLLPLTATGGAGDQVKVSPAVARVDEDTSSGAPTCLVSPSMRLARFTASPITVYYVFTTLPEATRALSREANL